MATLRHLHQKCTFIEGVITVLFIHFVCYSVKARLPTFDTNIMKSTTDTNINGGFSAHLIRVDSPHSPLHSHKRNLMGRRPRVLQTTLGQDSGMHLMKFSIGTPPVEIAAYADSGSEMLWTKCLPCETCNETTLPVFDPEKSSTYRNITCSDKECNLIIQVSDCTQQTNENCAYIMEYSDMSFSGGVLAKETLTMTSASGRPLALRNITMGCGHMNQGISIKNEMTGIIGLGRGNLSFVSQIAPFIGGRKFSYCLVPFKTDPKITSKISFGNGSEVSGDGVVSTPLVDKGSSYVITVLGITIANTFIPFNSTDTMVVEKGNMMVDSGSPLTYLPQDLYDRVVAELNKALGPELKLSSYSPVNGLSTPCINTSTIPQEPSMTVHFEGGGELELRAEQIFHHDPLVNLTCAIIANTTRVSQYVRGIYGALFQGNFLVGYDLDKMMISFKPTDCVKMSIPINERSHEL